MFFGAVTSQLFILYVYRFFSYSRTVFAIYAVLLLTGGDAVARVVPAGRRVHPAAAPIRPPRRHLRRRRRRHGLVMRELLRTRGDDVRLLGFIDDDPRKAGIRVQRLSGARRLRGADGAGQGGVG